MARRSINGARADSGGFRLPASKPICGLCGQVLLSNAPDYLRTDCGHTFCYTCAHANSKLLGAQCPHCHTALETSEMTWETQPLDRLTKSAQDQLRALTSAMVGQTTMYADVHSRALSQMERLTDQLAERDDVIRGIQQEKKQIEEEKKQVEKERNQAEEKYDKLSVIYSRSKESNHSDGAGRSEGRLLGPASSHSSSSSVEENEVSQRHNQEPARAARPAPTPPAAGAPRPAYQSSEVHSLPRQAPSPHVPLYRGPSSVPQSPMSMQAQPNGSYAGGAGRYYPPTATAYRQPSAPVAAAYKQPLQQTRSAQQFTSQVRPQPVASSYNAAYGGAPTASLQGNRRAQPQASQARPSAYPGTAVHPGYAQHRPVTVSRERSPASATRRTGAAAVVPPTARQQAPVFGQDRGFMSNGKPPVRRQVDTMM